jgi:surface polysaccharide O-acyltransferase-like enzyme
MTDTGSRTIWIDNIRLIATIAVIAVHVATPPVFTLYDPHSATNMVWWIGNVYDSFFRICVPLFVMITGSLLLPQQIGFCDFLKKRLSRILLPFLFWAAVYIAYNLAITIRDSGMQVFSYFFHWLLPQIVKGPAPHLWYIYMIIGIYLFIPIIKPWVTTASNKAILFFLGIWVVTIIAGQQKLVGTETPLDMRYFSGYIGYLILGYFLSERLVITLKIRNIAVLLLVIGYVTTLLGTYYITKSHGSFVHSFYEYLTVNVLLSSAGAFIVIKNTPAKNSDPIFYQLRQLISRYGYGIYLGHLLILNIMAFFKINYSLITPILGIPLCTLICLAITCIMVFAINKLPFGKYISG